MAAILVVAFALAACNSVEQQAFERVVRVRGPVLLLGDSILVGARDYGSLSAGLTDDGWVPETIAEESRTVSWALDQIAFRATVPSTVVVVLGSNPGPDLGTFPDDIAALTEALEARGAKRIVWLPPTHVDGRYEAKQQALLDTAGGRLEVADGWLPIAEANPQWFAGDGLHMSGEGYEGLAAFLRQTLIEP